MIASLFFIAGYILCYVLKVKPMKKELLKLGKTIENQQDNINGMKHHVRSFYKTTDL